MPMTGAVTNTCTTLGINSRIRISLSILVAVLLALIGSPIAHAAEWTAPTPEAPAVGAEYTAGDSVTFSWVGSLQGAPTELERSFFRVEIMARSSAPSDSQAAWPDSYDYAQTSAGDVTATSIELSAPTAGSWVWRVCAWGVDDGELDTSVEQLSGGCSNSISMTTAARASSSGDTAPSSAEPITITNTTVEKGETINETRFVGSSSNSSGGSKVVETTTSAPAKTVTRYITETTKEAAPVAKFDKTTVASNGAGGDGTEVADIGDDPIIVSTAGGGSSGVVSRGLNATIPGVPIPFWSLLLLACSVPVVFLWRRSVVGMFVATDEAARTVAHGVDRRFDNDVVTEL